MTMVKEHIKKITELLSGHEKVEYAFIFGSVLKRPLPGSDIDILVGAHLGPFAKMYLAMELELALGRKVDMVLTKDASCEVVLKALSSGSPVLIREKGSLKNDYFRNFYLYEDASALRKMKISRVRRRYGNGG